MKRIGKKEMDDLGGWCAESEIMCNRMKSNALAWREQRRSSSSICLLLASLSLSEIANQ